MFIFYTKNEYQVTEYKNIKDEVRERRRRVAICDHAIDQLGAMFNDD